MPLSHNNMEEIYNRDLLSQPAADNICVNCKANPVSGDNANKLCPECRQAFINYPIPKWIWAFAGGVLLIMIVGLSRMGVYMNHSIGLARAERAIENHQYLTAQNELKKVIERFPDNQEAQANMFIAACYNLDRETALALYAKLENHSIEDQVLFEKMNEAMNFYGSAAGTLDSQIVNLFISVKDGTLEDMEAILPIVDTIQDPFYKRNAQLFIASFYYDRDDYNESEKYLDSVFAGDSSNYLGLSLMAAIDRKRGAYGKAVSILKDLLDRNREDVSIIGQLSRTELAASNEREAGKWAKMAMDIAPHNYYALEAQSMVDYQAGRKEESFRHYREIKALETDDGDSTISTRLYKVISGQEKYK